MNEPNHFETGSIMSETKSIGQQSFQVNTVTAGLASMKFTGLEIAGTKNE